MCEILCHGKRLDNGEWVEGYYVCLNGKEHRIYTGYAETAYGEYYPDFYKVDPATVKQYASATDKNGKKIFMGDIVKLQGGGGLLCFGKKEFIGVVCLAGCGSGVRSTISRMYIQTLNDELNEADFTPATMEVIGNVHDNPELLEV